MAGLEGTLAILGADGATVHASMPFIPDKDGRVELRVPLSGLTPGAHILRATVMHDVDSSAREIGFILR